MRKTAPAPFDHHCARGGRAAFRNWVSGSSNANFSPEPVFRYGRAFPDAIAELYTLAESQLDIFLCNIVEYSSILTSRPEVDSLGQTIFDYADVDALVNSPNLTGYVVDYDVQMDAMAPLLGWSAICGEYSFDDSSSEAGLVEIGVLPADSKDASAEGTLLFQLANPAQFALNWRNISFPIYFIPPGISIDFPIVAERFQCGRLRDYLLRKGVPFGTMGECHMDDDIAVEYLQPVFAFPETLRCFIR